MNNPEKILRTLDRHLRQPVRVVLFGRAALALGYPAPPPDFGVTQDVDAILPVVEMARIEADQQFWEALDLTNRELEPSGLYMTHLFTDAQVVLTPDWLARIVPIVGPVPFCNLSLFRPHTADLILTKMMRNDPQDRDDIAFILGSDPLSPSELKSAFLAARVPPVPEVQAAFLAMQTVVAGLASRGFDRSPESSE